MFLFFFSLSLLCTSDFFFPELPGKLKMEAEQGYLYLLSWTCLYWCCGLLSNIAKPTNSLENTFLSPLTYIAKTLRRSNLTPLPFFGCWQFQDSYRDELYVFICASSWSHDPLLSLSLFPSFCPPSSLSFYLQPHFFLILPPISVPCLSISHSPRLSPPPSQDYSMFCLYLHLSIPISILIFIAIPTCNLYLWKHMCLPDFIVSWRSHFHTHPN